jgi:hypothetical protein
MGGGGGWRAEATEQRMAEEAGSVAWRVDAAAVELEQDAAVGRVGAGMPLIVDEEAVPPPSNRRGELSCHEVSARYSQIYYL